MLQEIIGSPIKNVVIETGSKFYIKCGARFYELDFRNLDKTKTEGNRKYFTL